MLVDMTCHEDYDVIETIRMNRLQLNNKYNVCYSIHECMGFKAIYHRL